MEIPCDIKERGIIMAKTMEEEIYEKLAEKEAKIIELEQLLADLASLQLGV